MPQPADQHHSVTGEVRAIQPRILLTHLFRYPEAPAAATAALANPVAARLLSNWRTHMPEHGNDGQGDPEDFWEMAARLTAALESGADEVWARDVHDHGHDTVRLLSSRTTTPPGAVTAYADLIAAVEAGQAAHYGPLATTDPFSFHIDRRADSYAQSHAFADHAGRFTALAGFALDDAADGDELTDVITSMGREGHREAVIKAVRAKHGLWRVPVGTDRDTNAETVRRALGWSAVHFEAVPRAFSVQEVVEMHYEYRVFVVDGEPVTGAGCLEERTPVDSASGTPFDPHMRRDRRYRIGAGDADDGEPEPEPTLEYVDPVEERGDLSARYVRFAREVAQCAEAEGSMPRAYVIDCAVVNGEPVVIEMNGCENAGLYASQPWLVTSALLAGDLKHASRRHREDVTTPAEASNRAAR